MQRNTFQTVLVSGTNNISYVFFFYDDIQWGLFSNIGFSPSFSDPTGSASLMIPIALTPETINVENTSNARIPGVYAFRVDQLLILQPRGKLQSTVGDGGSVLLT